MTTKHRKTKLHVQKAGISMLRRGGILFAAALIILIVAFSVTPTLASTTFGRWRDINPTQYVPADPSATLRGIYMDRSSGSASIGSGDGWAVGGDGTTGVISHYDGFSWQILSPPVSTAVYYSVNFCLNPGAPGVGSICTPYTQNGNVADGWLVGSSTAAFGTCTTPTCPVASYWNGGTLTEKDEGLFAAGAGNLTSVFMVCNSPETGQTGCSGPFQSQGLTYAVGQTNTGSHGIICNFNGDPLAGGSWGCPFTSTHATVFNSVYMYVDSTGNLGGFAVGDQGTIAQLTSGGWTESQPAVGVTFNSVFVDQGSSSLEAWAVGNNGEIWHFCCGSAGSWNGPVSPGATSQNLESVFLTSTSQGVIVGSGSVILASNNLGSGNGNQWLALTTPSQTATGLGISLIGLSIPSGGNGWAVGTQGVIIDTQNSNCGNSVISPCWGGNTGILQTTNLTSVYENSQNDAWQGGWWDYANNQPSLLHWDGVKWHHAQVQPPPQLGGQPFNITSISMDGSGDGWAVGGIACPPPGAQPCHVTTEIPFALHWDSNTWTGASSSQPVCTCSLTSVYMISSSEGWAVGDQGEFFHYTTSVNQWGLFAQATGNPKLNSVFINNNGANQFAGWAVGNNGIVYSLAEVNSVATWSQVTLSALGGATPNLYSVFFTDSNHGWIVGADNTVLTTTNGGQGWSGGENQVIGAPPTGVLRSVFVDTQNTGSGNGDGWAVGGTNETGSASSLFAHWDGQIWTATTISPPIAPGLALYSVWGQSGNTQDGWAVGGQPAGSITGVPLAGVFHLDPLSPPVYNGGGSGPSQATTTASVTTTATNVIASTVNTSGTTTSTSVNVQSATATAVSSSVSTAMLTSTLTSVSTSVSVNTLQVPGIPGFPWESILAGILFGITVIALVRRRRTSN
ncbi:MAG TPA: hypothetical protein VJZ32_11625 [Candidatus Bathyarchaeia archaeon]|nr:hypothetical protein [Candidatus Bathyarchaeia archaeon]